MCHGMAILKAISPCCSFFCYLSLLLFLSLKHAQHSHQQGTLFCGSVCLIECVRLRRCRSLLKWMGHVLCIFRLCRCACVCVCVFAFRMYSAFVWNFFFSTCSTTNNSYGWVSARRALVRSRSFLGFVLYVHEQFCVCAGDERLERILCVVKKWKHAECVFVQLRSQSEWRHFQWHVLYSASISVFLISISILKHFGHQSYEYFITHVSL